MMVHLATKAEFRADILSIRIEEKGAQASRLFLQNRKATGKMPILHASTFTVLFLDEDQRIHWKDIGEKSQIREWMVEAMLDLVKGETERIDSRFLETACGDGNFLVKILQRKLAAVEFKYGRSDFERQHYALLALMCIYGIELLPDNIAGCRANLLAIFAGYLILRSSDEPHRAAFHGLSQNLVHGDAMKMLTHDDQPITFAEWGYLSKVSGTIGICVGSAGFGPHRQASGRGL